jgi:ribosome-associated translation inhibitor RaiA
MIEIKFKNLEKSEMAKDAVEERMINLIEKFPDLKESKIQITLEMENSPAQVGPDFFNVKLHIFRGRYDELTVKKSDSNLYVALAKVVEHMLEALNRFGDRARLKKRKLSQATLKNLSVNNI